MRRVKIKQLHQCGSLGCACVMTSEDDSDDGTDGRVKIKKEEER